MEFTVDTNNVNIIQENQVESGEYNVTTCQFSFSNEYEGLTKKAVFTGQDGIAYLETIIDSECSIPSEVLATNQVVQIGVYAYEVDGEELLLRYSPVPTNFSVEQGSYKEAQNSTPPTPSEIEQLQAQITENANNIDGIIDDIIDINAEQTTQNTNIQTNANDIDTLEETKADKSEIPTKTSDLINDSGFIEDANYVHTDNNFTNADKTQIGTNKDNITTIQGDISNINSAVSDINDDIDNLEQSLTSYSLITETGSQIELNINSSDFKLKAILKDKNGNTIYTSNIIDLPLETMVVGASYDNVTKEVVLTLQNGTTVRFSVADLVSGLVSSTELQTILENYYTKTEIDTLLADYVKNTDYATSSTGGVVKVNTGAGFRIINGELQGYTFPYETYEIASERLNISKGTLENVIAGKNLETANNKVTSLSSSSTDTEYPSAKCVYDLVGDIESILETLDVRKRGVVYEYKFKNNSDRRAYR